MRILFFDTETNGLPKFRTAVAPSDWPAIVQVAWQVWDSRPEEVATAATAIAATATTATAATAAFSLLSASSYIVKPSPSLIWNMESQAIHLISKEKALVEGSDPEEVWSAFAEALAGASLVVAHNLAFDKSVVDADASRRGAPPYRWPSLQCCTMMSTKAFCRLPSLYSRPEDPYKYPKLSELHALLFGNARLIHFHNASVDVDCTVQCFRRLVELKVLPLEEWRLTLRVGGVP
jgi:DNA polymerase III epsilon subunit-like protein